MTRKTWSNVLISYAIQFAAFAAGLVVFMAGESPIRDLVTNLATGAAVVAAAGLVAALAVRAPRPVSRPA
ncbi:hypothetical protein E5163_11165 [Marinicauda algicola]|uniref:Uncharacterized protein n=1 Tax=Marinicauda algicola TaxID=2029849 RepID=A0A4S2GZ62_9PROT|nr:hypothetical protein [Marinicauda algicola]TGY88373.1 hypothetical protein E5163_11165 [Marinicauda algicola]